jgi:hypothetical protein
VLECEDVKQLLQLKKEAKEAGMIALFHSQLDRINYHRLAITAFE